LLDVYQRVSVFVSLLYAFLGEGKLGDFDTVLIVGHHGTFSMLLSRLLALDPSKSEHMEIPNCSVLALDRVAVGSGYVFAASAEVLDIVASPTGGNGAVQAAARELARGHHSGVLWFRSDA
jgi:broad specificity phosphatase PhoE